MGLVQQVLHELPGPAGFLLVTGAGCVIALVTLLGCIWYLQERLVFYPNSPAGFQTPDKNPPPLQNPGQLNMDFEDITIDTPDGCKLHAWFIKQTLPRKYNDMPTVLFFQGNAGNMGLRLININKLYNKCSVNIFAVSYRGYGYSTGTPSEQGVFLDAQTALDYLLSREDINRSQIIAFGRSIGGAVALDLTHSRQPNIRAVIVENTFTSLVEMFPEVFPALKPLARFIVLFQRLRMMSIEKVPNIKVPILYISGLQDELVPPEHVRRLHKASSLSSMANFFPVANGTHNDTWQRGGEQYWQEISRFIGEVIKLPPC